MKVNLLLYPLGFAMVSAKNVAVVDMQESKVTVSFPGSVSFAFDQDSSTPKRVAGDMRTNTYFHGTTPDGFATTNMITYGNDKKKMTIVDEKEGKIYHVSQDAEGDLVYRVRGSNEFPPEIDPVVEEEPDSTERNDSRQRQLRSGRDLQDDGSILDVMVVWTAKSECLESDLPKGCNLTDETGDNIRALIDLAVLETNTAYAASGVQTSLRLVDRYRHPSYDEDSGSFDSALSRLRSTSDGIMDDVHAKRSASGADLVALIIDHSAYCGIAYLGPSIGSMFSVTARSCATGYFSFGHEIGHNLGCNHDRGTSDACSSSEYRFGFRDPQANFRSIMAYNCVTDECDNNPGGGSCTRVQMFSNPNFQYNGASIGNAANDNVRRINDVKATVASYYQSASVQPTISPVPTKSPTISPTIAPQGACCPSGEFRFNLEVMTDQWAFETTWELTQDTTGAIMATNPVLSNFQLFVDSLCLQNGCYAFTIEDSYGDGICCSEGPGYFKGFVYEDEIFSGGEFGSTITNTFCNADQCTGTVLPTPQPSVSPTPSPSVPPTPSPTTSPTPSPSVPPTPSPTTSPTPSPTTSPTPSPTVPPTPSPTTSPTPSPSIPPTPSPTTSPTPSPASASPTPFPTPTPTTSSASPTPFPTPTPTISSPNTSSTNSPSGDPWLIYNTSAYHDSGFIYVSNDINSGPQGAGIEIFEGDCVTPLAANEAVSLSAGPIVNFSSDITYSLSVDESTFGSSQIVTFDDSTNSAGSIVFCTKLKTTTSSGMVVSSKKVKFDISFDMTNVAFTIGNIILGNDAPEDVNFDMVFSLTACECDETFLCVSNTYMQGSTAPELRVCITPGSSLSIQNFELELSNGVESHKAVSYGTTGPELDGVTYIVNSDTSQIMVVTRIIEKLYNNGSTSLSVSGKCLLATNSGMDKDRDPVSELSTYTMSITIQGLEDHEEGTDVAEKVGCLQQLLRNFF